MENSSSSSPMVCGRSAASREMTWRTADMAIPSQVHHITVESRLFVRQLRAAPGLFFTSCSVSSAPWRIHAYDMSSSSARLRSVFRGRFTVLGGSAHASPGSAFASPRSQGLGVPSRMRRARCEHLARAPLCSKWSGCTTLLGSQCPFSQTTCPSLRPDQTASIL
jgi:hypothetical protein